MQAINTKYQSKVNRVLAWNAKYDEEVNQCSSFEDEKAIERSERLQEKHWNKMEELMQSLPKREQANIIKSITVYM